MYVLFTLKQATNVQKGSRGIDLLPFGARWWWVVNAKHRPFYPSQRPGTHCTRGWVDPQGQSGLVQKNSLPPGIDPQNVQPVASRYTDYTIPVNVRTVCSTGLLDTDREHDGTKDMNIICIFLKEKCVTVYHS